VPESKYSYTHYRRKFRSQLPTIWTDEKQSREEAERRKIRRKKSRRERVKR